MSSPQAAYTDFRSMFYCPVTKMSLIDAQTLNCPKEHAVSKSTALDLFGKMQETGVCEKEGACPLCQMPITAYKPNIALQRVADAFFEEMRTENARYQQQLMNYGFGLEERPY